MTQIGNPSNKRRLLISLLVFIVCIAGAISLIWFNAMGPGSTVPATVTQERQDPRLQIDKMLDLASRSKELARDAVQYNPSNSEAQFIVVPFSSLRPQLERNLEELDQITKAYLASAVTDEEKVLINSLAADHQALIEKGLKPVFEAAEGDRFDDAIRLYYHQLEPAFVRYSKSIDLLKQLHPEEAAQG